MRLHAIVTDLESAEAAVEGGATVVQLRLKHASTEEVVEAGRGFRELPAAFVVNDDVEAALRLEAEEGERVGAAYLGAGPVWATPSKPDADPPIGLEGLAEICRTVSIPVVAIGGVTPINAAACIQAGAAGVAVVRAAAEARALRAAIDAAF